MGKTALLVGGTGPTGVPIARGLVERGYALTIFHRGAHESPELPDCEHIHGDPHFRHTIDDALAGRQFDLVVAAYGRLRHVGEALAGRCSQFISVGGPLANVGSLSPWLLRPFGMQIPVREEDAAAFRPSDSEDPAVSFSDKVLGAEQGIMALHRKGAFSASHFRYPVIYGPRQLLPREWSIVKRILDGRKLMILADGGLPIYGRLAARNAAEHILLAVDRPEAAAGEVFNCADERQFTVRQWTEMIADIMGCDMAMVSLPEEIAGPTRWFDPLLKASSHYLPDITKARERLGYKDVVAPREALKQFVGWLVENPIPAEEFKHDPFDYAKEDRLIAAYRRAVEQIEREVPFETAGGFHPYAHPKAPTTEKDHRGR